PKEMEPPSFFRGGQNPSRTQAGQPAAGAEATVYVNDSAANPPAAKQATLPRALDLQSPNPWPGVIPGYHPAADAIRWSNGCNVEAPVTPQSCPAAPVQRPRPVVQAKQETAAHVSPTVAPPYLQNRLKQQIERTCGKGIFDVEVLIRSYSTLVVRFRTLTGAEADRLSQKIMQMPEMIPYQVNLEVRVGQ